MPPREACVARDEVRPIYDGLHQICIVVGVESHVTHSTGRALVICALNELLSIASRNGIAFTSEMCKVICKSRSTTLQQPPGK